MYIQGFLCLFVMIIIHRWFPTMILVDIWLSRLLYEWELFWLTWGICICWSRVKVVMPITLPSNGQLRLLMGNFNVRCDMDQTSSRHSLIGLKFEAWDHFESKFLQSDVWSWINGNEPLTMYQHRVGEIECMSCIMMIHCHRFCPFQSPTI